MKDNEQQEGDAVNERELEQRLDKLEHDVSWLRRAVKAVVDAIKSAAGQLRKVDIPEDDGDDNN